MNVLMRLWRNKITTTFLAGLITFLPVVLTVVIIAWMIKFLETVLGPDSYLGVVLKSGGTTIIGPGYDTIAFSLGVVIALLLIFLLGVAVRSAAQRGIESYIDRIFTKLPLIRAIYNPVSRVVRLTIDKNTNDFSGMPVVFCRFGGAEGADMLGLLANQEVYLIAGQRRRMVYLPMAPFMTGGLTLVPEEAVILVPEMKVDDLMRVFFSLGALAPDAVPAHMREPRQTLGNMAQRIAKSEEIPEGTPL
jgi:uncharacterized membrane protein